MLGDAGEAAGFTRTAPVGDYVAEESYFATLYLTSSSAVR